MQPRRRALNPTPVIVLQVIAALVGLSILVMVPPYVRFLGDEATFAGPPTAIGVTVVGLSLITLVAAAGLWTRRTWAPTLSLIVAIVFVGLALIGIVISLSEGFIVSAPYLEAIINGIIIYYLRQPSRRQAVT
jgi:uncharacterized membrane protein (DUF2068 family)